MSLAATKVMPTSVWSNSFHLTCRKVLYFQEKHLPISMKKDNTLIKRPQAGQLNKYPFVYCFVRKCMNELVEVG